MDVMPWIVLGSVVVFGVIGWLRSPATTLVAIVVALLVVYVPSTGMPWLALGILFVMALVVPFLRYLAAARQQLVAPDEDSIEPRDEARHKSTTVIDAYFAEHTAAAAQGLAHHGDFVETLRGARSTTLTFWRIGGAGRERLALHGVVGRQGDTELVHPPTVMVSSLLESGDLLVTTNAKMITPFQGLRSERFVSAPSRRDVDELLRVHRARLVPRDGARNLAPVQRNRFRFRGGTDCR